MSLIFQTPGGSAQFLSGAMLSDEVLSSPLAGTVNNLNISGQSVATLIRLRATAAVTLTGMLAPPGGAPAIRWLSNDSAFPITIPDSSGSSDAGNKFSVGGSNLVLAAGVIGGFLYNPRTQAWGLFTVGANPAIVPSGSVVTLGAQEVYVAAAGSQNNVTPAAAISTLNRLNVDTAAGNATFTGLAAGADGQVLLVTNVGANDLTLANANVGSTAANRLYGVDDITLPSKGRSWLCYGTSVDGAGLARWTMG